MAEPPTNVTKIASTSAEKIMLWLIRDLVVQNCDQTSEADWTFDGPRSVFSGFIGVHAEAIAFLADYGLVTDLTDNGGRVVSGKLMGELDTASVLKTGPYRPTDEAAPVVPEIGDHLG